MSFEEEFDKKIKQKVDEASFPFDEGNWAKASNMLDAERNVVKGKSLNKFYLPALVFLMLTTVTLVTIKTTSTNQTNEKGLIAQANEHQEKSLAQQKSLSEETVAAQENSVTPENTEVLENINAIQSQENTSISDKPKVIAEPSEKQSLEVSNTNNQVSASKKETKKSKVKTEVDNLRDNSSLSLAQHLATNNASDSDENVEQEDSKLTVEKIATVSDETSNANKDALNIVATKSNQVTEELTQKEQTLETSANINALNAESSIKESTFLNLNAIVTALPVQEEKEIGNTPIILLARYDEDYYKKNAKPFHFLNIEAGASYLMGWQTQTGVDGEGLNWFGGANYGVYLSKKIAVGAGLQVYNISHIKDAFSKTTQVAYGFGSTSSTTIITTNSLYYISVPFKIYYTLNQSNQLGFGFNAGYLFNSKNTLDSFDLIEGAKQNQHTEIKKGIYEGLSSTNMMLSAFYNMKINKRFSLNGEVMYGLTDIFLNKNALNKNTESPLGLRISVKYTLFDK